MSGDKLPFRHVAVEGPIGVGKTSLVQLLAERFEGVMVLEDITNPFLPAFYEGKPGAAFQVQIYFLLSRFQQQRGKSCAQRRHTGLHRCRSDQRSFVHARHSRWQDSLGGFRRAEFKQCRCDRFDRQRRANAHFERQLHQHERRHTCGHAG